MRLMSRLIRFFIAAAALASYALGPVLEFVCQDIPLYRMAGLTAGLYFSPAPYLFPVFALGLFALISLSARRGTHQLCISVAAVSLFTAGIMTYFFLKPLASAGLANLSWLFEKATALLQAAKTITEPAPGDWELFRGVAEYNMARLGWGYWASLVLLALSCVSMPKRKKPPKQQKMFDYQHNRPHSY
ncbi:MAG: hypothetical protein FWF86_05215 [Clostridia bacterium]|nr:hypothetical protein [Clostridia bacterium]